MTATRPAHDQGTRSMTDEEFSDRAHRIIPGGAHTYSRGDDQFPAGAPRAFVRGKGARVVALDGSEWVDWGMGIKNVLIGHAEDAVDDAAIAAIRDGQSFSRPTPLELIAAERVVALFPGMDMVKFCKNGSDANTAAVRLARAVTGRDLIGYDASAPFLSIHDWFIGTTAMRAGVPEAIRGLSVPFRYNDQASIEEMFERHRGRLAAVILEVCRDERPHPRFLERIRELCDQHGTLLVFDEVLTGFCYAKNGAYSLFGVIPDLLSIGKALANGYALSALLGKREHMERGGLHHRSERVFLLSTTNGPERSALAAAIATMELYDQNDVIGRLYKTGRRLIDGLEEAASRHGIAGFITAASEFACRPALRCFDGDRQESWELRTLFLQEMASRRVFIPWVCVSFRHGRSELAETVEAMDAACAVYARALEAGSTEAFLRGPAARPVFRTFN